MTHFNVGLFTLAGGIEFYNLILFINVGHKKHAYIFSCIWKAWEQTLWLHTSVFSGINNEENC